MAHHLDRPIASDLSYFSLQKRRQTGELSPCALDSSNQRLYPLSSQMVQREAFIGDREIAVDQAKGGVFRRHGSQ